VGTKKSSYQIRRTRIVHREKQKEGLPHMHLACGGEQMEDRRHSRFRGKGGQSHELSKSPVKVAKSRERSHLPTNQTILRKNEHDTVNTPDNVKEGKIVYQAKGQDKMWTHVGHSYLRPWGPNSP